MSKKRRIKSDRPIKKGLSYKIDLLGYPQDFYNFPLRILSFFFHIIILVI